MGYKERLADELGVNPEAIIHAAGRFIFEEVIPGQASAQDLNTAMTASQTTYWFIGKLPKGATLIQGKIRSAAAGVGATTTIDILKVASGTAVTAGTAMVTQVAANGLTPNTDYNLTINTDGSQNANVEDMIVAKIVTQGVETLKPPVIKLVFKG